MLKDEATCLSQLLLKLKQFNLFSLTLSSALKDPKSHDDKFQYNHMLIILKYYDFLASSYSWIEPKKRDRETAF
jgi:hypothetical protein